MKLRRVTSVRANRLPIPGRSSVQPKNFAPYPLKPIAREIPPFRNLKGIKPPIYVTSVWRGRCRLAKNTFHVILGRPAEAIERNRSSSETLCKVERQPRADFKTTAITIPTGRGLSAAPLRFLMLASEILENSV